VVLHLHAQVVGVGHYSSESCPGAGA
jgi:hypothetical protein